MSLKNISRLQFPRLSQTLTAFSVNLEHKLPLRVIYDCQQFVQRLSPLLTDIKASRSVSLHELSSSTNVLEQPSLPVDESRGGQTGHEEDVNEVREMQLDAELPSTVEGTSPELAPSYSTPNVSMFPHIAPTSPDISTSGLRVIQVLEADGESAISPDDDVSLFICVATNY